MMNLMQRNEIARRARQERAEREYQAAMLRVTKMLSMLIAGAAGMLTVIAWAAGVKEVGVVMSAVTVGTLVYGVL